jgi:hypothetical protein
MRNTSDAKATWKNVAAIDLKDVREQLNLRKGWWWRLWHNPMDLELEYRRFLFLLATNLGQPIVPWSDDLNDFWLEHQRDAEKYAVDCYSIIGAVMNQRHPAAEGTVEYQNAWRETRELYQSAFKRKPSSTSHAWNNGDSYDPGTYFGPSPDGGSPSSGHHDAGGHTGGGHHGCASHGGSHGCGGHGCGGHGCGGHGCGGGGH